MKKFLLLLSVLFVVSCVDVEVRKTYYDSGQLQLEVYYVDGLKNGEYKFYWESGELKRTENYVDDLRQGEWKWYYKSGELEYTRNYVDGVEQ
jgi:antitoxin component YwqK of YwqJK toxin-antitoxin module